MDVGRLFRRRTAAGVRGQGALSLLAASAPAAWLRGRHVVGPAGRRLGAIALVVRRSDGARLAVVHEERPSTGRTVLDLAGGTIDGAGLVHVTSAAAVHLLIPRAPSGAEVVAHGQEPCDLPPSVPVPDATRECRHDLGEPGRTRPPHPGA